MYQSTNKQSSSKGYSQPNSGRSMEDQYIIEFEDPRVRRAFMRKVFMIILMQLVFSLVLFCMVVFIPALNELVKGNMILFWVTVAALIVLTIMLGCFESLRRKSPLNYFLLGAYTVTLSLMLCFTLVYVKPEIIFSALGITTVVVMILIVFALQTRFDFTVCGCGLFIAGLLFLVFGIVCIFIPSRMMLIGLCSVGVLLLSIYLIYDVQLMMGGKHRYALSPEEYIFAAMNIYTDIMLIFFYIMNLLDLS